MTYRRRTKFIHEGQYAAEVDVEGRSFQLGEGWHSSEHPVHFWHPLPRILKEADTQCYACTTAYAMMIRLCNVC